MDAKLAMKYERTFPLLDERQRRLVAASDAEFLGRENFEGGFVTLANTEAIACPKCFIYCV